MEAAEVKRIAQAAMFQIRNILGLEKRLQDIVAGISTDHATLSHLDFASSGHTQDSSNRLTTDAEKSTWNGKQDALGFTPLANTAFSGLAKITVGATAPVDPAVGDLWVDTN